MVLNASPETPESLRPEIRAFVEAYEDAFESRHPAALSALHREDADIIVPEGPAIHGAKAIQDRWQAYLSEPRPYRVIHIMDEIRMPNPDVALLSVTATGATQTAEDRVTPTRQARGC